jgi:hypothetical protein
MYKLLLMTVVAIGMFSCEKEPIECPSSIEKTIDLAGFTKIVAGEAFHVTIKQGASFSIKAKGCANDLDDLQLSIQNGGVLDARYHQYKNNRYRVDLEVTMPVLVQFSLGGAAKGAVSGFDQQSINMRATLSGTAGCIIEGMPALVKADVSGSGELFLHGTTGDLIANVSGTSKLHAYTATFSDIDIYTDGTAKAYIKSTKSLVALASGDSRIYYKGNPASVNIEESGTAKVVHE